MTITRTKATLFSAIIALALFTAAEAAFRVYQYFRSGTPLFTMLPQRSERRFQLSPFLVFGPRVDFQIANKPNPDYAYFNSQGFRTREVLGKKPAGEFRIIAIGGSTTEEIWNEEGLHWPLWLERELQKAGLPNVRVYNTGMSSYTSAHSLIRVAFDVMEYEPDMVVELQAINDLCVNYRAALDHAKVDPHYKRTFTRKRFTGEIDESDIVLSRLVHGVTSAIAELRRADEIVPEDATIVDGLRYYRRNLGNLHALVANAGARLVLLTMPVCDSEKTYRQVEFNGRRQFSAPLPPKFSIFTRDFDAYNDTIKSVAAERKVDLVDMKRLFGGDEKYFADFVHYNAAGSKRFGEILATELTPVVRQMLSERSGVGPTP